MTVVNAFEFIKKQKKGGINMTRFETLCNEYRENKRLIEELTAMNDSIKADIIGLMGDNDTMIQGATKVTNKLVCSVRFDSTGFKKVYPGLYSEYSHESSYRRFIVS